MLAISDSIRAIEASIALLLHYLLQKSCRVQGMRFILIPIHSETLSGDLKRPAVPAGSMVITVQVMSPSALSVKKLSSWLNSTLTIVFFRPPLSKLT